MTKPASITDFLPTCERCRHWHELTESRDQERRGICRRYPPVPFVMEDGLSSEYPPVEIDDTCGEFGAQQ